MADLLSRERLRWLLDYDPLTGWWRWKHPTSPRMQDAPAGCLDSQGYIRIKVDGRGYRAHRLAFLYMTGELPTEHTDHVNGDRADNRWLNLRQASCAENQRNARRRKDNTSGFKGVHFSQGRWRATLKHGGKTISLGGFSTPEDAHAAYVTASRENFGEFARAE